MPLLPPSHETRMRDTIPFLEWSVASALAGGEPRKPPAAAVSLVNADLYSDAVRRVLEKIGASGVAHLRCVCDLATGKCTQEYVAFEPEKAAKFRDTFDSLVQLMQELPDAMRESSEPAPAAYESMEHVAARAFVNLGADEDAAILGEIMQLFMARAAPDSVSRPPNVHVELFSPDVNILVIRTVTTAMTTEPTAP